MIFKIFPEKSATIYSQYPFLNSGNDEILEVSNQLNTITSSQGLSEVSRILIQFPSTSISASLSTIGSTNYKVYLRMFLANASAIPLDYTLFCYPISGTWDRGTGYFSSIPQTQDGVSWKFKNLSTQWPTSSLGQATASFQNGNPGGGNWYTSSLYVASQSFNNLSDKDILLDVTNIISSSIGNGMIIKHSPTIEFLTSSLCFLKYFSANTHTIYPPCLEFRYNDNVFITGSGVVATNDQIAVTLVNNLGSFQNNTKQTFRINVRDKFPTRAFQTSSVYLNNKFLPSQSFWALKDLHTEETVIDFDTSFTTINCDGTSSMFTLDCQYLEPERYYKILIKTLIGNEVLIFDNQYNFKVVR